MTTYVHTRSMNLVTDFKWNGTSETCLILPGSYKSQNGTERNGTGTGRHILRGTCALAFGTLAAAPAPRAAAGTGIPGINSRSQSVCFQSAL